VLRPRIIPVLTVKDGALVKTTRFRGPVYVGDPVNAVRIFNEKGVDEIVLLDIGASVDGRPPDLDMIEQIAGEAYVPVAYGGGVTTVEQCNAVLRAGVEKVCLNSAVEDDAALVAAAAARFGSQSVVGVIDVARGFFGAAGCRTKSGRRKLGQSPVARAKMFAAAGAGEIFVNDIDREGTGTGYDLALIGDIAAAVNLPLIACGGARNADDLRAAIAISGVSAAATSMFVFTGKHRAVLISVPAEREIFRPREIGDA
jgi:cyclase